MRRRAKIDKNQPEIVKCLRDAGATVQSLSQMGHGVPDLLVGWRGKNFLFEVKDPNAQKCDRQLTDDEKAWHFGWCGQVEVVQFVEDVIRILDKC